MDSLSFFRRNLKPLMAAMTLMAMISFLFLDDRKTGGGTFLVPVILAFLFGGGAFVWGTRKSKQNEYGTMGAVVGAVLGLVIATYSERDNTEQKPIAGLSHREIANLKSRRESANRILGEIYRKSHPIPEQFLKAGPFGQQFYDMQLARALEQIQFKFGNDDFEKDVIFGDLLRREAVRLGINVNDDAVTDFIKMISDQNLTKDLFRDIKQQLHVTDHYVYDLFRDELAARMAAEMTYPRAVSTPQQRWQDFRKVNVKQSIEATTIAVEAFVKGIPDPSDDKLIEFFKKHAEKAPGVVADPQLGLVLVAEHGPAKPKVRREREPVVPRAERHLGRLDLGRIGSGEIEHLIEVRAVAGRPGLRRRRDARAPRGLLSRVSQRRSRPRR